MGACGCVWAPVSARESWPGCAQHERKGLLPRPAHRDVDGCSRPEWVEQGSPPCQGSETPVYLVLLGMSSRAPHARRAPARLVSSPRSSRGEKGMA